MDNEKEFKYIVCLTEKQLKIIEFALSSYSRLALGNLNDYNTILNRLFNIFKTSNQVRAYYRISVENINSALRQITVKDQNKKDIEAYERLLEDSKIAKDLSDKFNYEIQSKSIENPKSLNALRVPLKRSKEPLPEVTVL